MLLHCGNNGRETDDVQSVVAGGVESNLATDSASALKSSSLDSSSTARLANNYSPPPLFANVTTTVTLEDIAALAGAADPPECRHLLGQEDSLNGAAVDNDDDDKMETRDNFVIASKRRRRIEIPKIPTKRKNTHTKEQQADLNTMALSSHGMNATPIGPDDKMTVAKEVYLNNFRAGGTEFMDKHKANAKEEEVGSGGQWTTRNAGGDDASPQILLLKSNGSGEQNGGSGHGSMAGNCSGGSSVNRIELEEEKQRQQQGTDIKSIADLVSGKMKFLSEGRPAVSGVQAMAIQLEVSLTLWFCVLEV